MKKSTNLAAVSVAIAAVCLVATAPRTIVTAQYDEGYQPIGTWAWSTHRPSGGTFPALVTYHRDGTITGSDGLMFGIDYPPALNETTMSPFQGVWERTGPHTFKGTSLWLQFAPEGTVIGWGRVRSDLHYVGDPDHFEGMMYLESLPCPTPFTCPDPVTSVWTSTVTAREVSAVRVTRVEPPGL